LSYFLINAALLLAALKILGFKFMVKTIYAIIMLSLFPALGAEKSASVRSVYPLANKTSSPTGEEVLFAGSKAGYSASDHSITTGKWSEGYFRL
jgi:uncharacterized membrane-anchored protein YitT (DUF2179 family)